MKNNIRVVLDTNVLVSGLITPRGSSPHQIYLKFKEQKFLLLTSAGILGEVEDVINRPHLVKKYQLSQNERRKMIKELIDLSFVVSEANDIKVILSDPDDDKFISCAIFGKADYLVSGDNHLLKLNGYQDLKIITPKEFVEMLDKSIY